MLSFSLYFWQFPMLAHAIVCVNVISYGLDKYLSVAKYFRAQHAKRTQTVRRPQSQMCKQQIKDEFSLRFFFFSMNTLFIHIYRNFYYNWVIADTYIFIRRRLYFRFSFQFYQLVYKLVWTFRSVKSPMKISLSFDFWFSFFYSRLTWWLKLFWFSLGFPFAMIVGENYLLLVRLLNWSEFFFFLSKESFFSTNFPYKKNSYFLHKWLTVCNFYWFFFVNLSLKWKKLFQCDYWYWYDTDLLCVSFSVSFKLSFCINCISLALIYL